MTLSGVQMARFIYGMALWCLLDKGPEIIEFVKDKHHLERLWRFRRSL